MTLQSFLRVWLYVAGWTPLRCSCREIHVPLIELCSATAGLRQRYNLDAPAAAETTIEETAAAPPQKQRPDRPGISTDAAILGLHPAFRGSITQSLASLRSGQLTTAEAAAGGDGTLPQAAAEAQDAAALPFPMSPGATSESGSCLTPQPAGLMSASQLAGAEAPVAVSPTDAAAAAAGAGAPTAVEAPAGAAGAVAAAATPHSTAAMPAAWRRAQHSPPLQDSLLHEGRGGLQQAEHAGAFQHTAFERRATTTTAAAAAAGNRQGLEGDAARMEGSVEDLGSSASSSPSSIAKPLFAAFTAAAKQAAEQQLLSQQPQRQLLQQQHEVQHQQQQQEQRQQEASGSEVTLQSMLDSPQRRRQQSPQQQRSPSILQPGSPPRPLLGVWATRAATAAVPGDTPAPADLAPIRVTDPTAAAAAPAAANTPADAQPAGSAAAADALALPPAVAAAAARDPADVQLASTAADTQPAPPQQLSDVQAVGGSSDDVAALPEPAAPSQAAEGRPDKRSQTASSPAVVPVDAGPAAQAASDSALSPEPQQQPQQPPPPELPQSVQLQRGPAQSAGAAADWARLSDQLSAAGFGHLALAVQECDGAGLAEQQQLAEQQVGLLPALPGLYDSFCRVSNSCGFAVPDIWLLAS